jgi:CBS domain-containing protein
MGTSQVDARGQRRSLVETLRKERIRALMHEDPLCVEPQMPTHRVIELMREHRSDCALACVQGRLEGIFTERDYLAKVAGDLERIDQPIASVMSRDPKTLSPDDSVGDLIRIIVDGGYRHLPVVSKGVVQGLVASLDIVKYIGDLFPAEVYNLPPDLDQIMPEVEGA